MAGKRQQANDQHDIVMLGKNPVSRRLILFCHRFLLPFASLYLVCP
jgi:hypothetical protein